MFKQYLTKQNVKVALVFAIVAPLMAVTYQGCTGGFTASSSSSQSSSSISGRPGISNDAVVAGQGGTVAGTGALSCPTAQSIVSAVVNVLGVSVTAGNTAKAYPLLIANLPAITDCTKAGGYDNAQLFIYAACSDLTTGSTPAALSKFGVTLAGTTVSAQQSNLVAAGVTILNGFTAGIAGNSSATAGINTALTKMLTSSTPPSTTTIAFMDVCIAATSAGSLLLGN